MLSVLHSEAAGGSIVCLSALRASSCCKHDMGALLWLNVGTLERVIAEEFASIVMSFLSAN